jgi:hypothetical protein
MGLHSKDGPYPCLQILNQDLNQEIVKNSLAYFKKELIMAVKGFMDQAPGPNFIKLFTSVIYECSKILECLSLSGLSCLIGQ